MGIFCKHFNYSKYYHRACSSYTVSMVTSTILCWTLNAFGALSTISGTPEFDATAVLSESLGVLDLPLSGVFFRSPVSLEVNQTACSLPARPLNPGMQATA